MIINQYQYELFADYFQFSLENENAKHEHVSFWDKSSNSLEIGLDTSEGIIVIGTERNFTVPVFIEIHDSEPNNDLSTWDRVNECSIDIPSGTIVVLGLDYYPEAARIKVDPQVYRARIYYGGLDTVKEFDQGKDVYKIALWAAPFSEVKTLKIWTKKA